MSVTYQGWMSRYRGEMKGAGATAVDAHCAAHLGYCISGIDEAVFSPTDMVLVDFEVNDTMSLCVALYQKESDRYCVFPVHMQAKLTCACQDYGLPGTEDMLGAIALATAVHEVRHRAQRHGRVRRFDRATRAWAHDPLLREVLESVHLILAAKERQASVSADEWVDHETQFGADEFDACVVERLTMLELISATRKHTFDTLARIALHDAPLLGGTHER